MMLKAEGPPLNPKCGYQTGQRQKDKYKGVAMGTMESQAPTNNNNEGRM